MDLNIIGINHQTAPISIREQLAFTNEEIPKALQFTIKNNIAKEILILSTCNRTEIYSISNDKDIIKWLADYKNKPIETLLPYLYKYKSEGAVKHAFKVASGLNSMIIGEPQILGQFKTAIKIAMEESSLGTRLNLLFQRMLTVAKEIRFITNIEKNSISMASASIKMIESIFYDIKSLNVLLIGAGEMIEIIATYFNDICPKNITVANRTLSRAKELIEKITAKTTTNTILFTDIPNRLFGFDVVISSTASQLPILGKGMVENALSKRKYNPIFLLDLAVPRDIEEQVNDLENAYLYTIDDIQKIVQQGKHARKQAAIVAENMLDNYVTDFINTLKDREKIPIIIKLKEQTEEDRQELMHKARKMINKGTPIDEVLEIFSKQLVNKLLNPPLQSIKDSNNNIDYLKIIKDIYKLK